MMIDRQLSEAEQRAEDIYQNYLERIRTMRATFTITLKVNMREGDDDVREAYKDVLRENAETLYAQCSIFSRASPTISVTMSDEEVGTHTLPLFIHEEDYSGS